MKAGCPSENMPPNPAAKFRLTAATILMPSNPRICRQNGLSCPGAARTASAKPATAASVAHVAWLMASHLHALGLAEQSARPHQQHQDQDQEDVGVAILGQGIRQVADEECLQQT